MFGRHQDTTWTYVLNIVRLRRLFEHTRKLADRIEDGQEKYDGEYIFDRHYIAALVDGVIEELNRVVYHGAVLCPEKAGRYYDRFDALRTQARSFITGASEAVRGEDADSADIASSPEFKLLAEALVWMRGRGETGGDSPLALMFDVVDGAVVSAREVDPGAAIHASWDVQRAETHHLNAVDLELVGAGTGIAAPEQWVDECRPLRLLLGGAAPTSCNHSGGEVPSWSVAVTGNQVSVFGTVAGSGVFVEVALTGHAPSDFLLLYMADGGIPVPQGMRRHETRRGTVHWLYGVDRERLETAVRGVGERLFA